jgi:hypothetical protein
MNFRSFLLCACLLVLPSLASAQDSWTTYRNTRFGTSIEYPSRFKPGRPPDNNDGQSFTAADGAGLSVWGSLNVEEDDLAGVEKFVRENSQEGDRITYRTAGQNWFVLSGTRADLIFYKRYMLSHRNEIINAFEITYPAALASAYGPIVARLSKSLRAGRGYQIKGAP